MLSPFIVPYSVPERSRIKFLQPYYSVFWGNRWHLVFVDLLTDDLRQVGRWYRSDMPVNLTRSLEVQGRQECVKPERSGRVVPVNPVRKQGRA